MKTYAIRQVGTDDYMPNHKAGKGGWSNDEPVLNGGDLGPRLLPTFKSAQNAISAWKQGAWYLDRSGSSYDDYEEELTVDPKPHRKDINLEVVEFHLIETVKLNLEGLL